MNVRMEWSELKEEQEGEKEQREAIMFVRTLQELSRSMEAIEELKAQENQSETTMTNGKECMWDKSILYYIIAYLNIIYYFPFDTKLNFIFKLVLIHELIEKINVDCTIWSGICHAMIHLLVISLSSRDFNNVRHQWHL